MLITGQTYDFLSGSVSQVTLALSAFAELGGPDQVNVNVVTHLTYGRIKTLLQGGMSLAAATSQAESELVTALDLGGPGFTLSLPGDQLDFGGGNTDANAYLVMISALFDQLAVTAAQSGSLNGSVQEVINSTQAAFATDGTIPAPTLTLLQAAERVVEPNEVAAALSTWLSTVAPTPAVPDINQVIDSDLDGFVNAKDNCALVANANQQPVNGVCDYYQVLIGPYVQPPNGFSGSFDLALGDLTGSGEVDAVDVIGGVSASNVFDPQLEVWMASGAPGPVTPTQRQLTELGSQYQPQLGGISLADINGDGRLDLIGTVSAGGPSGQISEVVWLEGEGDGGFSTSVNVVAPYNMPIATPGADGGLTTYGCSLQSLVDLNGDGVADALLECEAADLAPFGPNAVVVELGRPDAGFGRPELLDFPRAIQVSGLGVGDFNSDGRPDVLVSSCSMYSCEGGGSSSWSPTPGLWIAFGAGDAGYQVQAVTTSVGPDYPELQTGDINGDGRLDIVVGGQSTAGPTYLDVLLGDGAGNFTIAPAYSLTPPYPPYFQLNEITQPGSLDLVFYQGDPSISVSLLVYPSSSTGWLPSQSIPLDMEMGLAINGITPDAGAEIAELVNVEGTNSMNLIATYVNVPGYHSW